MLHISRVASAKWEIYMLLLQTTLTETERNIYTPKCTEYSRGKCLVCMHYQIFYQLEDKGKKGYFESVCTTSEDTSIKLAASLWTSSLAMHIISCFNS